ncbi:hypothetical protein M404DRAFT_21725 [Pisolithus tinctorius Marx 270]|uniref:Uncharacterized protein n=1 Tax=Pisolithus tinctorius Marx 270 TaxID=870435 RepID=A0A0C3JLN6_PISTI|nr:hypothetical protein M404DRAFT_21725 [Pisolithus tinctorius Marx 270]
MSICQSRTPYDQDLLPNLTQVMSKELQVGSDDNNKAIQGKLAKCKRCKVKVQEEAQLAEEAWLEAERQEQAWLEEERACTEAAVQRIEAEEARKAEESWQADALVGSLTRAGSNIEVMNPCCLCCAQTNMSCLHNTDGKKRRLVCNQCNELKEHCQWPVEGETGTGVGLAGDKGKRKADVTSPCSREKKKRLRHPSAKVLKGTGDEDDVGEGPSTSKKASLVTSAQMERLIKAVECVADNMASLAMAQREVSQNFYWFAWSYETYVEECFEFLVLDMPSDQNTTDEEDKDVEGLDDELEGLREEEEESQSWSESGDQTGAGSASQV